MTAVKKNGRQAVVKKWAVWLVVIASIAWTVYNWSGVVEIKNHLESLAVFALLFAFSEACFVIGALMVAIGGGKVVFAGTGKNPLKWALAVWRVRTAYRKLAEVAPSSRLVRIGFHLNWLGAVLTGVFLAAGIILVLPMTSWGLLVLPLLDILASFGWRYPIEKRLDDSSGYRFRSARLEDIPAIVALDASRYEDVTTEYAADPAAMFERRLANAPDWFWVMEDYAGAIVGILSTAPVAHGPADFVSWEHSTADGTLDGVVDPKGEFVYVVALTTSEEVGKSGDEDRLIAYGLGAGIRRGYSVAYFSGRMPGYHYHPELTPQAYYDAKTEIDGRKVALDKQIRLYESLGMRRIRLVENGFEADWKSSGYGVLFQYDLPFARPPLSWLMGTLLQMAVQRPWLWARVKKFL